MAEFHIPVTEYNEWRTNELPFTRTYFGDANIDTVHVPNDGRVQIIFKVESGEIGTNRIMIPTNGQVDGLDIDDITSDIASDSSDDKFYCIGPLDAKVFNNAAGEVVVHYEHLSGFHDAMYSNYYVAAIRS